MSERTLWNKDFILDTVINFLVYLIYYLLMVIIAVVAKDQLNASMGEAGLASGIFILGTLVARLQFGNNIEIYGRKKTLYGGMLFYLITTLMYFFIPSITMMFAVRFLNGLAYGITSTATNTIVTACIPVSKKGQGINYYGLSTSLAAAIGPFLGMILLLVADFRMIIGFCCALIVLCMIGCFMLNIREINLTEEQRQAMKKISVSNYLEPRVWAISLVGFLMGFSYSSVLTFLASYAREINLVEASTLFFVFYAGIITLTRPATGVLFDRKGENSVLYPCYVCLALGMFLLAITTKSWELLLSGIFIGLGYGTFMSNGQAVCIKITPPERVSVALSTYFVALDLGIGVGPYVLGSLHDMMNFSQLYETSGVIAIVCLIIYYIFHGRRAKSLAYNQEDAKVTVLKVAKNH